LDTQTRVFRRYVPAAHPCTNDPKYIPLGLSFPHIHRSSRNQWFLVTALVAEFFYKNVAAKLTRFSGRHPREPARKFTAYNAQAPFRKSYIPRLGSERGCIYSISAICKLLNRQPANVVYFLHFPQPCTEGESVISNP
jgi:hypothetical protein